MILFSARSSRTPGAPSIAAAERVGGRILEVGVGTGISLPDYASSTRLVGVDLSEPMLRKAQARVRELGLSNVEGLAVMDAEHMAFPDSSFDVIVAQLVVTTVPNPEATLDEFAAPAQTRWRDRSGQPRRRGPGLRRRLEQSFTPITRICSVGGWNSRGRAMRAGSSGRKGVRVIERSAMPPFGHFSLIRFGKSAETAGHARGSLGGACHRLDTRCPRSLTTTTGLVNSANSGTWKALGRTVREPFGELSRTI